MRTNLAERRIGYEPPEVPEGESLEERRERIRAIYQWRKAMRRLARLGCIWLSGVGFALCIIAGCATRRRSPPSSAACHSRRF